MPDPRRSRSFRPGRLLVATLAVIASLAVAAPVVATTGWTDIARIPGTAGLVNPIGATASDGTDLALWRENTGAPLTVRLRARVRLSGSSRWRDMGFGPKGIFLQDMAVAPTLDGSFWIAYQVGVGGSSAQVRLTRLDPHNRTWSKPRTLFTSQTAYGHAGAGIALGGDGTLAVTAYARPIDPPAGDPVYRATVTVRRPGGRWVSRFLSRADEFGLPAGVDLNTDGDLVVGFTKGYDQADDTAWAATLRNHPGSDWKVRQVSAQGDGYRPAVAIGDDGTAAIAWSASATSFAALKMATIDVDLRLDPWLGRDVVTSDPSVLQPHVVVAHDGEVTIVWRRSNGGTSTIWTGHLGPDGLSAPLRLTPLGEVADFGTFQPLQLRPDGKVALLYQSFDTTPASLGFRYRVLDHGVPGPERVVTRAVGLDGAAQYPSLGLGPRSHVTVIYQRGTYPATDFAWVEQAR